MIKYQTNDEPGIHIIQNRFRCCLSKRDKVFNLSDRYRQRFELGLIISIFSLILVFQFWKKNEAKQTIVQKSAFMIDVVEEIPQTTQTNRAPAPSRPSVPIASEDETIPEDETIEFTDIDFEEVPPPPPPPQEEIADDIPVFVPFDEPPTPIGGIAAIQKNLVYPEVARLAGVEGIVLLHVQIEANGDVKNVRVMKSLGISDMDQSAINAVRAVKWKPAMQRDMPIMVWYSVPIRFALTQE